MLEVSCPGCVKDYVVGDEMVGTTVRCKACGETFVVHSIATQSPQPRLEPRSDEQSRVADPTLGSRSLRARPATSDSTSSPVVVGVLIGGAILMLLAAFGIYGAMRATPAPAVNPTGPRPTSPATAVAPTAPFATTADQQELIQDASDLIGTWEVPLPDPQLPAGLRVLAMQFHPDGRLTIRNAVRQGNYTFDKESSPPQLKVLDDVNAVGSFETGVVFVDPDTMFCDITKVTWTRLIPSKNAQRCVGIWKREHQPTVAAMELRENGEFWQWGGTDAGFEFDADSAQIEIVGVKTGANAPILIEDGQLVMKGKARTIPLRRTNRRLFQMEQSGG